MVDPTELLGSVIERTVQRGGTVVIPAFAVGRAVWGRMLRYREELGRKEDRVTGFLAEMFGAVQALKVASAERNAVGHLATLNDERRKAVVRAQMLEVFAYSLQSVAVIVGTGMMLLTVGEGMAKGSFTVGDFALFTYFLWFTTELPSYLGTFVGDTWTEQSPPAGTIEAIRPKGMV